MRRLVSKIHLKLLLWLALLLVAAGVLWLLLRGLGDLVAYFQRGADPASALNIVPNVPPDLHVTLAWLPDDADTGRAMEPYTRRQIEAGYLRAWLQWNLSYLKGEPFGLKTYFSGPALGGRLRSGDAHGDGRLAHRTGRPGPHVAVALLLGRRFDRFFYGSRGQRGPGRAGGRRGGGLRR